MSENIICLIVDCPDPKKCPQGLQPVCGSDGITYNNQCLLDAAKCKNRRLKKKHYGPCKYPS